MDSVLLADGRHELHADADPEQRNPGAHPLVQRVHHAGQPRETGHAVDEGTDARQHDAVRPGESGPDRRSPSPGAVRARPSRRARTPSPPSAGSPSRNRRWRRSRGRPVFGGKGPDGDVARSALETTAARRPPRCAPRPPLPAASRGARARGRASRSPPRRPTRRPRARRGALSCPRPRRPPGSRRSRAPRWRAPAPPATTRATPPTGRRRRRRASTSPPSPS